MKIMSFTKYLFVILIIVNTNTSVFLGLTKHISKLTDLAAVTHFEGIDVFYRTVKVQKIGRPPRESRKPLKKIIRKKSLCYSIFGSSFFTMKYEQPLNLDDIGTQMDLAHYHQDIFDSIFIDRDIASHYLIASRGVEYVNDYKRRPVHLEGISVTPLTEFVFSCPVWAYEEQIIKEYFVSEEYNVNFVAGHQIAGRFIFLKDPSNGRLKIEALAEESALQPPLVSKDVPELYYTKRRKKDGRTETKELDPVCRLSSANKLRLCASVFASESMRDKYLFWPSLENLVHEDCLRVKISFVDKKSLSMRYIRIIIRAPIKKSRIYDEWVIGCKVVSTEGPTEGDRVARVYYVSRGDLENTVFVYANKFDDSRVFVDGYFNNVSVVARLDQDLGYEHVEIGSETASESGETSSYASAPISLSHSSSMCSQKS